MTARLTTKLREALEFFNDHPNFSLRFDRARTSYKIAGEIDKLLAEIRDEPASPPAPELRAEVGEPDLPTDAALQVRFADTKSFTPYQMEAALCAWEWMLENQSLGESNTELWEGLGASGMRSCSQQAGAIALQVYEHMEQQGYEFIGAYDWEFIPEVLVRLDWRKLSDDNQYARAPYRPDIAALFAAIFAADLASHPPPHRFFWKRDAA